jgi:hypothetical protein
VLLLRPTANWTLNYTNTIDLSARRFVQQEYHVIRRLHCWQMELVRRFVGDASDFYFKIGLVDRPEIFIDRGTSGLGSVGGYNYGLTGY